MVQELPSRQISICIVCRWNINSCIGSSGCSSRFCTWTIIVHSLHIWHSSYYCNDRSLCMCYANDNQLLSFEDTHYAGGKVNGGRLHQPCPSMANKQQTSIWFPIKLKECGVRVDGEPLHLNAHRFRLNSQWYSRQAMCATVAFNYGPIYNQVSAVVHSCNYNITQLLAVCSALSQDTLRDAAYALVLFRLNYCNSLYAYAPVTQIWRLQMIINMVARVVSGRRRFDPITNFIKRELIGYLLLNVSNLTLRLPSAGDPAINFL